MIPSRRNLLDLLLGLPRPGSLPPNHNTSSGIPLCSLLPGDFPGAAHEFLRDDLLHQDFFQPTSWPVFPLLYPVPPLSPL